MTGSHSRNKGRRGELEWAKKVGGHRDNDEGLSGIDVRSKPIGTLYPPLEYWEVKRRASIPATIRTWLKQMHDEGADAVAFREDRGDWYVIIRAERLDV